MLSGRFAVRNLPRAKALGYSVSPFHGDFTHYSNIPPLPHSTTPPLLLRPVSTAASATLPLLELARTLLLG
jgi:hypothetical protein